jgi:GTP 3',8-cyclase
MWMRRRREPGSANPMQRTLQNQEAMKAAPGAARDAFGRTIDYLRLSVTDVCNLRCVYCMPEDMTFRPGPALLQDDEFARLIRLFASSGFTKIRFTGGEPTLHPGIVDLVRTAVETPGIRRVALTMNGMLLDQLARPLKDAGLAQINVSLDTLDSRRYREMTRWGSLRDVLEGIEAAERVGLPVKLNAVVVRGLNDGDDIIELARLTLVRDWQVRFIEMMPFGGISEFQVARSVPEEELRAAIAAKLGPLDPCNGGRLDGEARVYRLHGAKGSIGFVSPLSNPFCGACNRMRMMADGVLRLCLLHDREVDLRRMLRTGADDAAIRAAIVAAVRAKPWGHDLAAHRFATNRAMSEIGG